MRGGSCFPRGSWVCCAHREGASGTCGRTAGGGGRAAGALGRGLALPGRSDSWTETSGRQAPLAQLDAPGNSWRLGCCLGDGALRGSPTQRPLWWKGPTQPSTHFRSVLTQPSRGRSVGGSQVELAPCTVTPPFGLSAFRLNAAHPTDQPRSAVGARVGGVGVRAGSCQLEDVLCEGVPPAPPQQPWTGVCSPPSRVPSPS